MHCVCVYAVYGCVQVCGEKHASYGVFLGHILYERWDPWVRPTPPRSWRCQ